MSSRLALLHAFEDQLVALVPEQPPTRLRTLADLALGMVLAQEVTPQRIAAELALPDARATSTERRCWRWLANPGTAPQALWPGVAAALLRGWTAREVVLVYDPTPLGPHWQALMVGVVWGGRARPLGWRVTPLRQPWQTVLAEVVPELFREVAAALPRRTRATLLLDRGLAGPGLLDAAQAVGWDVVVRLPAAPGASLRVQAGDGRERPVGEVVAAPGRPLAQPVRIFKAAGWRDGWLTVWRAPGEAEPWVLFSTRRGGMDRVGQYRLRMTAEATYADLKRRGLDLERTRMRTPARLEKLLMAAALAIWWLYDLGAAALRQGFQAVVDRGRGELAVWRIGWYWLTRLLEADALPPLPFVRGRTGWRLPDPAPTTGPPRIRRRP